MQARQQKKELNFGQFQDKIRNMIYSPKKFNIQYQAIFNTSDNNIIRVWLAQPLNSITQKIESFSISPKPQKYYKDTKENKILYFEFKDQENFNIQMDIKTTLWKNKIDLTKEKFSLPSALSKLFRQYTKTEKFLEQIPAVKKLTHQITKNNKSILDKIYSITKFLEKNFKYAYPIEKRGIKNLNLKNLKGDCGEVGALFVTMCRILGIPARNVTGYVIYEDELNNIYEHGWTNVYFNEIGWLPIDPLARNIKKTDNKYLYQQKNYFIALSHGFNIKLFPKIPVNYKIDFWNKLGLPLSQTNVQILQPLVFSSKDEISFKDNIALKQNNSSGF